MIKDCITYLNAKLDSLGYFNDIICLAEKIEREGRFYPAIYVGNEYKEINLDVNGSVCYWRKSGDVNITEQENITLSKNIQYEMNVPLKLICFLEKGVYANDQYFADNLASEIMSYLTTNNSALKIATKAKKVSVVATSYKTDSREVGSEEYNNIDFEARYTHAYFSIDFELKIVTNNQCYADICADVPVNFGYVSIYDGSGTLLEKVACGGTYICSGGDCADATVENSDATYSSAVASGATLVLPDTTFNVYIDGSLNQSSTFVTLGNETINISL